MVHRTYIPFIAIVLGTALTQTAYASSDEAWVQFSKDVSAKCLKAVGAKLNKPTIVVDPYGSDKFGLAIVSGKSSGNKISYICVYDKKTTAVELGGELEIDVVKKAAQ